MTRGPKPVSEFAKNVYANLSVMPHSTSVELTKIRGFPSERKVYRALKELQKRRYVSSVRHFPSNASHFNVRYFVGAQGMLDFPEEFNSSPENILKMLPCSADWQRETLKRADALAVLYELCMKIAAMRPSAVPMAVTFPRSSDFDALVTGADGFCLGMMRKGNTMARSIFRKKFWAVTSGSGPDNHQRRGPPLTLVIVPTTYDKQWLSQSIVGEFSRRMLCAVATEHEALVLSPELKVWLVCERQPYAKSFKDMIQQLDIDPSYSPSTNVDFKRVNPPRDSASLLQFDLRPLQKQMVECLADWPMLKKYELGKMLSLKESTWKSVHFSQQIKSLIEDGIIEYDEGTRNLILDDGGLRYLAYRDKTKLSGLRKKWETNGTEIRKMRKGRAHTEGINKFVSQIYSEHPGRIEALPDHATSRRYSIGRGEYSQVKPDAAMLLRLGGDLQSVLLEYEMRGSRGGGPLWDKVHVWLMYYIFEGKQFVGNLSLSENPLKLDDEVTLFIVASESIRQAMLKKGQALLKRARWSPDTSPGVPVAITTLREATASKSLLTDKIWLRMDDYHLRETNPILSDRRRASPRTSRR